MLNYGTCGCIPCINPLIIEFFNTFDGIARGCSHHFWDRVRINLFDVIAQEILQHGRESKCTAGNHNGHFKQKVQLLYNDRTYKCKLFLFWDILKVKLFIMTLSWWSYRFKKWKLKLKVITNVVLQVTVSTILDKDQIIFSLDYFATVYVWYRKSHWSQQIK
jgi:hypothetical protein